MLSCRRSCFGHILTVYLGFSLYYFTMGIPILENLSLDNLTLNDFTHFTLGIFFTWVIPGSPLGKFSIVIAILNTLSLKKLILSEFTWGIITLSKLPWHTCLAGPWTRINHSFYPETKTNKSRGSNFSGVLVYI